MKIRSTLLAALLLVTLATSAVAQERVRRSSMPTSSTASSTTTSGSTIAADTSTAGIVFQKVQGPATIVLKVDGLKCTADPDLGDGETYINSWRFGANLPVKFASGSGADASNPSVSDISISKAFNGCSPALLKELLGGKRLDRAAITVSRDGKDTLIVTLEGVWVSGFSVSGQAGEEGAVETLELAWTKIKIENKENNAVVTYDRSTLKVQ